MMILIEAIKIILHLIWILLISLLYTFSLLNLINHSTIKPRDFYFATHGTVQSTFASRCPPCLRHAHRVHRHRPWPICCDCHKDQYSCGCVVVFWERFSLPNEQLISVGGEHDFQTNSETGRSHDSRSTRDQRFQDSCLVTTICSI